MHIQRCVFSIRKGEIAVIQGLSGIGKSTFFKLLLGILKSETGEMMLNFKNNKANIGSLTRKYFSYVPQDNMIFSGTIRDNISFPKKDLSDTEIKDAARRACILDYITSLPEGLDTQIGENGLGLSKGQIQRIAIARALCHNTPVLLLDEATSALDEKTEKEVLKSIRNLNNKACIIITHREIEQEIINKRYNLTKNCL